MVNILIVEDDSMARKLLEIYMKDHPEYVIAATTDNADYAESICVAKNIHLVLMDVCTRGNMTGLDAARRIKETSPNTKVIIITSQPECTYLDKAREAGVESFWYKNIEESAILDVIEKTLAGESIYPDTTPVLHLGEALSVEFTDRELDILRELVAGETDAEISEHLHLSLRTVKWHIQNMRDKTGFRNRTELAVRARESGLIIG